MDLKNMFTPIQKLDRNQPPQFVKIVYSHQMINGKLELIPLELYTDGSLRRSA